MTKHQPQSAKSLRSACFGVAVLLHVAVLGACMPHWGKPENQARVELACGEAVFECVALPAAPAVAQHEQESTDAVEQVAPTPVPAHAQATPALSTPEERGVRTKARSASVIQAEYPRMSQIRREEGTAVLRIEVLANGRSRSVTVMESSGYERLDRAAVQVMQRARFVPASVDGKPVESELTLRYCFRLQDGAARKPDASSATTVSMR